MARVTVEDCIERIPNRFELVIKAAQRSKQISGGAPLTIDRDRDKDAVVSLREIADTTISLEQLEEDLIQGHCHKQLLDQLEHEQLMAEAADAKADEPGVAVDEVSEAYAEETQAHMPPVDENASTPSFSEENIEADD